MGDDSKNLEFLEKKDQNLVNFNNLMIDAEK